MQCGVALPQLFCDSGSSGRAGEIRTHDLLHPMQAFYQAELRPDLLAGLESPAGDGDCASGGEGLQPWNLSFFTGCFKKRRGTVEACAEDLRCTPRSDGSHSRIGVRLVLQPPLMSWAALFPSLRPMLQRTARDRWDGASDCRFRSRRSPGNHLYFGDNLAAKCGEVCLRNQDHAHAPGLSRRSRLSPPPHRIA